MEETETMEETSAGDIVEEPTPSEAVVPTYTFVDMNATMYAKHSQILQIPVTVALKQK